MKLRHAIAIVATCSAMVIGTSGVSGAVTPNRISDLHCSGGTIAAGSYQKLIITGICSMPDSGAVHVHRGITVRAGAVLNAITPALVTVDGGIRVGKGAILGLGCSPAIDCDVTTNDRVYGDIRAVRAAAVILHSDAIRGNVNIYAGGGGVNCDNNPVTGGPLYVDVEDSQIYGHLSIDSLETCWLGIIRDKIYGNVFDTFNTMADPDANEVVTNQIYGDLWCEQNSPAAQAGDSGGKLNFVTGTKYGECADL